MPFWLSKRWRLAAILLAAILLCAVATAITAAGRVMRAGPPPAASDAGGPVAGEAYLWRPVAVGGGGFITGLSFDARGAIMVARADVHGAYVWSRAAQRWVQLVTAASMPADSHVQNGMNEGVYEIAVAPGDANRLYMAIKGRVYRSDNAGVSWILASRSTPFPLLFDANSPYRLSGPFMAVSPDDRDLVYLGTPQNGLWRSANGGLDWERVGTVPASAAIDESVMPPGILVWFGPRRAGHSTVYAASAGHGLFVSEDGNGDFTPLTTAHMPGPTSVTRVSFAPDGSLYATDQHGKALWRFRDGQWTNLVASGRVPAREFVGIAVRKGGRQILATDAGGDAWCSANHGGTWLRVYRSATAGKGDPPWLKLNDQGYFASGQIAFDPAKADQLWAAAGTGPYHAEMLDGCIWPLNWESQVRGIEELVATDAVQPAGGAPLFSGLDFGIHLKPDLNSYPTSFGPKPRLLIAAQQIDWTPSNPAFLVTNASDTRTGCCSEDGDSVLAGYSDDGGVTWTKFATLPQPPGTRADDPWRMAFGTIAVSADTSDNIVWAPGYNRAPFYTLDRGASWQRVVLPGETLPETGSFANIWLSRKTLAADRVLAGTFYLYHSGEGHNAALKGLWRTRDGGRRWSRAFTGELAPNSGWAAKLRAVPGHGGHLFFTAAAGGDGPLRRSIDGGLNWSDVPNVQSVDDIGFGKPAPQSNYPTLFISGKVGGRYGIWRSVDSARSWQRVADFPVGRLDQVTVIAGDLDTFGRVYLGYMGSGWIYGEPAPCHPAPMESNADRQCVATVSP